MYQIFHFFYTADILMSKIPSYLHHHTITKLIFFIIFPTIFIQQQSSQAIKSPSSAVTITQQSILFLMMQSVLCLVLWTQIEPLPFPPKTPCFSRFGLYLISTNFEALSHPSVYADASILTQKNLVFHAFIKCMLQLKWNSE